MKIQIDIENKTITICETVKLKELYDALNKILPNEWQSYDLVISPVINWINPIYVYPRYVPPYGSFPWTVAPVYCGIALTGSSGDPNVRASINGIGAQGVAKGTSSSNSALLAETHPYIAYDNSEPGSISQTVFCIEIK